MYDDDLSLPESTVAEGGGSLARHTLRGEILRVVYVSDNGEYAVIRLLDRQHQEHTLTGPLAGLLEGQEVEATGRWQQHQEHGRQLRVENFHTVLPSTEDGIRRYLASGFIPGVGPKMAERIVACFGDKTMDVLDKCSDRLNEVPGIGRKRIEQVRASWRAHRDRSNIFIFLQGIGLGAAQCARLFRRYGAATGEVVRLHPYQLAAEVQGIGFLTADRIAQNLGVDHADPMRLAAGAGYTLQRLSEQGHVCCPRPLLVAEAARILNVDPECGEKGIARALQDGTVVEETLDCDGDPNIYLRDLYQAECGVAESLVRILRNPVPSHSDETGVQCPGKLNSRQRDAVANAFEHRLSVITGGPGVGKTTVVGEIVHQARQQGKYVLLAAPTGRAAKRLSESSGISAKTIHRLLKWDPQAHTFQHNHHKPLRCNMLIIDEVSMLDVVLADSLFAAIGPDTHVVLVGDRDQLPSVGPGTVLRDIIESEIAPVTHLTEIYRQDRDSRIIPNAHAVNSGRMPDLRHPGDAELSDFYWIDQTDPERVQALIAKLVCERIPQRFHMDPVRDVQVLAPMNRGVCGTVALNQMLQQEMNGGATLRINVGENSLRLGDRVMQVVNNYDKSVFNGDLGRISSIDKESKTFHVDYEDQSVEYEWAEADQIRLAYSVTIHKSQGSEFPVVIVPVLTQHYVMLQRNLIYTAMTRARKLLVMIGSRKALAMAIRNNQPTLRYTQLVTRTRKLTAEPHP